MNPKIKGAIFFGLVLAALFVYEFKTTKNDSPVTKPPATATQQQSQSHQDAPLAPDFSLLDLDGNKVALSDYKGKVVFVNFWATWCGPCRGEIPEFVELIKNYGDDDFAILGISVDNDKDYDKLPGFVKQYSINYPVLLAEPKVVASYGGIEGIPTTFVIDRQGRALGKIVGARDYATFEKIVKSLLQSS